MLGKMESQGEEDKNKQEQILKLHDENTNIAKSTSVEETCRDERQQCSSQCYTCQPTRLINYLLEPSEYCVALRDFEI